MQVFFIGTDGQLWDTYWDGEAWHERHAHGGELVGSPAACSWGPDRIDVFARGRDGTLQHRWYEPGRLAAVGVARRPDRRRSARLQLGSRPDRPLRAAAMLASCCTAGGTGAVVIRRSGLSCLIRRTSPSATLRGPSSPASANGRSRVHSPRHGARHPDPAATPPGRGAYRARPGAPSCRRAAAGEPGTLIWLDLQQPDSDDLALLTEKIGLHQLAREDIESGTSARSSTRTRSSTCWSPTRWSSHRTQ